MVLLGSVVGGEMEQFGLKRVLNLREGTVSVVIGMELH